MIVNEREERYFLRYSHLFRFIDHVAVSNVPVAFHALGSEIGLCRNVVTTYRRVILKKMWIGARFYLHSIGLGTVLALLRKPVNIGGLPYAHWLRGVIDLGRELLVIYNYPFFVGGRDEGALRILSSLARSVDVDWSHVFPYRFRAWVLWSPYWKSDGIMKNINDILNVTDTVHRKRPYTPNWRIRIQPRDHYDFFLIALLEWARVVSVRELARDIRDKLGLPKGIPKLRTHIEHLITDQVIRGIHIKFKTLFQGFYWLMKIEVPSGRLVDVISFLVRFPFTDNVLFDGRSVAVVSGSSLGYVDVVSLGEFVRDVFGCDVGWFFLVPDSGMIRLYRSFPFRNYNILEKRWCFEKDEVDAWYKKLGFRL